MNREELKMVIISLVLANESSKDMTRTDFRDTLDELVDYLDGKANEIRNSIRDNGDHNKKEKGVDRSY